MLPFLNLSSDPEQEYFADGMVEEIITALSRIRWLFVIARNSSFTYKGQSVDVNAHSPVTAEILALGRHSRTLWLVTRAVPCFSFVRWTAAGGRAD